MTTSDFIDVGSSLDLSEAIMMSVIVGSSSFLASLIIQVKWVSGSISSGFLSRCNANAKLVKTL